LPRSSLRRRWFIARITGGEGRRRSAYKQLLGPPVTTARGIHADPIHPGDYSRLVFHKRKLSVYFVDGEDKGVLITT
jgi:hypothetical protein